MSAQVGNSLGINIFMDALAIYVGEETNIFIFIFFLSFS